MYQLDLFHINNVTNPARPHKKRCDQPHLSTLVGIFFMRLVTNVISEALGKFVEIFNLKKS
jgi:hypothetical protein